MLFVLTSEVGGRNVFFGKIDLMSKPDKLERIFLYFCVHFGLVFKCINVNSSQEVKFKFSIFLRDEACGLELKFNNNKNGRASKTVHEVRKI